jgi:predicted metal-dependent hydrolase
MEHLAERGHFTLKATEVATEQGEFTAVISTASIDREKDIVDPEAMAKALRKWHAAGKLIPLAWNHSSAAADQIGHIKPDTVKVVGEEVHGSGWIDQSIDSGPMHGGLSSRGRSGSRSAT